MKMYICYAEIWAKPMTLGQFCKQEKVQSMNKENKPIAGYCIEHQNGYVSWMPQEVFDAECKITSK